MAVSRYFGLPGCGKTTTLTMLAVRGVKSGTYKNVYCNVHLAVPGVTYIPFEVFGHYELCDCLILIDEAMVNVGARDYKKLEKEKLQYFVEHRHHTCDIVLFSQDADGTDKITRCITDRMYYVKKGWLLGSWITTITLIPYGLIWPTEKSNGENLGKIVMGYKKPPWYLRLFSYRMYRPQYYKYFDSWEVDRLPELPSTYKPYAVDLMELPVVRRRIRCTRWLFKSVKKYRKQLRRAPKVAAVVDFMNLPESDPEVTYAAG